MNIYLYTKDNVNFWAEDYSDSEILMKHLIGTRYVSLGMQMENLFTLAKAHGWDIITKQKL